MSTYTPPTISDGDAFDPETIKDGFDDFGTAINAAVDTNNIVANQLEVQNFHKNAITEVWKASGNRLTISLPVRFDASGSANTLEVQSGRNFSLLNKFDVEDTSIRFYLQHAADVSFSGTVGLTYAKTATSGSVTFTHTVKANLYLNGTSIAQFDLQMTESGQDAIRRPIPVHLHTTQTSLAAGWHDAWITLDFRSSTESGGSLDKFIHWISSGRSLNIVALYR
tara:strand:+ start:81 stop:752 length:672 start_codon:yes stop_codon:yes gene_type:complete